MGTGHRHPHLRAFVLGSLAVHALLLVAGSSSSARFGAAPHPPLSVRLEGAREAEQATRQSGARADRTAARNEHILRADAAAESAPVAARADAERDSTHHAPVAGAVETGNDDELRARIEARARLDLARHFEYPYAARLRGWEGSVLLAFIVQASGNLNDIRIVRSSGFAVLDHSAVDSLKKVQHLPEAVAWLQGRDIEMQLPVIYRLKGEH